MTFADLRKTVEYLKSKRPFYHQGTITIKADDIFTQEINNIIYKGIAEKMKDHLNQVYNRELVRYYEMKFHENLFLHKNEVFLVERNNGDKVYMCGEFALCAIMTHLGQFDFWLDYKVQSAKERVRLHIDNIASKK